MRTLMMLMVSVAVFAAAIPVSAQIPVVLDSRLNLLDLGYQPVAPVNLTGVQGATTLLAGMDAAGGFYQELQETVGGCPAAPLTRSTIHRVGLFGVNRGVVSNAGQCVGGQATNFQLTPQGVFFYGLPGSETIHVLMVKQSTFVSQCVSGSCNTEEVETRFFAVFPINTIYFE